MSLDGISGIFSTALTGAIAIKSLDMVGNMLGGKHPTFEVTEIKKDGTTGQTLGYAKAKTRQEAIDALQKQRELPNKVRVYPVKLVKKKPTKVFDFDHYFNYDFVQG